MDAAVRTTLVPTAAGARFAVSSAEQDPRRAILIGLLRGAARAPVALRALTAWTGLTDKKVLLGLLFKMQRDGLVNADASPLAFVEQPLEHALPPMLRAISDEERALLADDAGFCVACAGYERRAADALAAVAAEASRFYLSCVRNVEAGTIAGSWVFMSEGAGAAIAVAPLHIGQHLFHVVIAGAPRIESSAFVRLTAELVRYCHGDANYDGTND
jgi:hypothetical protein